MSISFDFSGKTAIVTGGASGIGLAMARELAAAGATVQVFDLDAAAAEQAAASIGASCQWFQGSVTDPEDVAASCDAACQAFGKIDILMNNAGIAGAEASIDLALEDWRRSIDINLTGVFLFAQTAARHMRATGGGAIVNTASMFGIVAGPERASYCASKAGVVALTKVLASEWAALGIRVNAIGPGYVDTALTQKLSGEGRLDLEALKRRTPAGRLGSVEEIARSGLYLASDAGDFITGQVLVADGGWSSYSYI
ncbi:SDR family NAD(P)-dependent oxidoreductase [Pseudohoeflea coraliihabitans]|uniref:Glucose 1-dehydrogenase n=1 Tax=Pseudohoeflea coraliihabitans TaxID=2860393 RepID=A0ABS6WIB2_9HYPH|nr:glucose 1-dehydrogenase [Pseudohoeflea sp. DP4N28-3]MBW3095686.1 glucose 1-dehydrogenase [Pseudohoeflea sp. DP4N28-3]